jgi:predicted MFS family arabinose efflux permease
VKPGAAPLWRLRAGAFLSSFDRFTIPPLLVPIHRDLGVSLGSAAAVASVYFIAYGVSQPLWGALSDRIGRVRVLRLAVAGGGLACVVAVVAQDLGLLIAARALAGVFFAAVVPTAMTYIGDTVRLDQRQHALAILMAFSTSGIASATVVAGVAAELLSWRAAFVASAALAAALSVVLRRMEEPRHEAALGSLGERLRAIARQRWVRVVMALGFVEGALVFGSLTFVAASLQQAGTGPALAGSAAAGFGLANVLCTPLVTRAIPRLASPVLMAFGSSLAAVGLLVAALEASVVTALVATAALGAGFGFLHSTMQMWATQVYPQARAVTVSFFAGAIFTGGAVASAAAAPLADDGRFSLIFLAAAAGAALLAVVGSWLRARYLAAARPSAEHGADEAPIVI